MTIIDLWDGIDDARKEDRNISAEKEFIQYEQNLRDEITSLQNEIKNSNAYLHSEEELAQEKGNHSRRENINMRAYIDNRLVDSDRYIIAFKTLNENRDCTRNMIESARTMLSHHHGDNFEDLYFISSLTTTVLKRTDYRIKPKEVYPTAKMKELVNENPYKIISIHNHPDSTLPSFDDLDTCREHCYKYGLIVCHNGSIYQYSTPYKSIDEDKYFLAKDIFEQREEKNLIKYWQSKISKEDFVKKHNENWIIANAEFLKSNVIIKEVLWNDDPQRPRNFKEN